MRVASLLIYLKSVCLFLSSQGLEEDTSQLMQLPHVSDTICRKFNDIYKVTTLKHLGALPPAKWNEALSRIFSSASQSNEFARVFKNLPKIGGITLTVRKVMSDDESSQCRVELPIAEGADQDSSSYVASRPHEELELEITAINENKSSSGSVFCPRYHKSKTVSWWLVLGCTDGELVAMKRIGSIHKQPSSHTLLFSGPTETGESSSYIVFLIPDSVYGIEVFGRFNIEL